MQFHYKPWVRGKLKVLGDIIWEKVHVYRVWEREHHCTFSPIVISYFPWQYSISICLLPSKPSSLPKLWPRVAMDYRWEGGDVAVLVSFGLCLFYQLKQRSARKKKPQLISWLTCTWVFRTFSWLKIDVRGLSPLEVVPSLCRWSWECKKWSCMWVWWASHQ